MASSSIPPHLLSRLQERAQQAGLSPADLLSSLLDAPSAPLSETEHYLRSLLDSQSTFVLRTDTQGTITYCNIKFTEYGQDIMPPPTQLIGTPVLDFIHPADHNLTIETIQKCIITPGQPQQITLRKLSRDHQLHWTLWEFVGLPDDNGNVTEIQCIGFQITSQIEAQELAQKALIERERLKAVLQREQKWNATAQHILNVLSHELRIPLSIINSSSDLLYRYYERYTPQQRREKLDTIHNQVRRMKDLIDSSVQNLHNGREGGGFQPRVIDLAELCRISITELQESIGRQHYLHFETDGSIRHVVADDTLISRILINLISNAIKYSPTYTHITVHLRREGSDCVLQVRDQGIGIPSDDHARIFEVFYRGRGVGTVAGTGLGLSIVRESVQLHHGSIKVESAVGQGSTFTVRIPYETA